MNQRERYVAALTFGNPDKIPFLPGNGRESTLAKWRSQGLPQDADPNSYLREVLEIEPDRPAAPAPDLGVDFLMRPQYEEKILKHENGQYTVQDWKGNICEISDEFNPTYLRFAKDFVTRRWIKCPVENRDDWEQMKARYDSNDPGRFPDDFEERCRSAARRDTDLLLSFHGPFWQMREWCGFEGLCMLMIDDPELVDEMADFWTGFVSALLQRVFSKGHGMIDTLRIMEDMAYKAKAMISPEMTRRFCKPSWSRWTAQAKAAGVPVINVDSDGFIGELIPIWIECGINSCDPVEAAAHNDIVKFRAEFGHEMAYLGGVDKRAMARGGKAIYNELKRLEPVIKDGGFIPSCDHGIPSDVSWANFVDYGRLLAKLTGWL